MADKNTPTTTDPISTGAPQTAPRLTIAPDVETPDGAVYVHKDYVKVVAPWAVEAHIAPISATERFGDVESWVSYVTTYMPLDGGLLTWSERGLNAVLDYHSNVDEPGRCRWIATHPFEKSSQWSKWATLANGQPRNQKQAIESLEDLSEDIVEPVAADLIGMLRRLRASVNASAETELQADGSTSVSFKKDSKVESGKVSLPAEIAIQIPVLRGHTEEQGGKAVPVLYRLAVRVRPSVGDDARLTFRFTMPTAERVLEAVYADRVMHAKALLDDAHTLLRSAGGPLL